ncbi:interferon-induced, double-stranded RNA-activated protein kinase-like [Dendronephthya gigantea]|uniref:interferon-induced, double-stranded RNA-activated protein kinase-like n=1 Tax=Dendronephthya gigantea TaxID=151771 RepID=UPI00106B9B8A|nr:interferon-induced, double-stranded RNA-activated protein kinase-like [Dendronephthya gigantea]
MTNETVEYDKVGKALELKYTIDGLLGMGAFGDVYKAKCTEDEKTYAIKVLPYGDEGKQKYQERELKLLTKMKLSNTSGSNVIKYFKSWLLRVSDGGYRLCIQMELCSFNLRTFVSKHENGMKFIQDSLFHRHVFHQILNGLVFIHSMYWVHRDIHPGNILIVNPNPQQITDIHVKIADFGLARNMDLKIKLKVLPTGEIGHENEELTQFYLFSNCAYMAPELATNNYDFKVDMYSAGVVLYFISCFPLKSDDQSKLKSEIEELRQGRRDIRECLHHKSDEILSRLILGLIQENPKARFSAHDARNFMSSQEANDLPDGNEAMVISPAIDCSQASKITFIARVENEEHVHFCVIKELTLSAIRAEVERNTNVKADQQALFIKRKINNEDMLIIIKDDEDVKNNFQDAADKHYEIVMVVEQRENIQENSNETSQNNSGDTTMVSTE